MTPWELQEFEEQSTALLDDRRRSERTAPMRDGTHLWLSGNRRMRVEVIDESDSGIGVIIPDMSFAIGPRIEVDYCEQRRMASVAYLNQMDDGRYRLGLEWVTLREV